MTGRAFRGLALVCVLACALALAGCFESRLPDGVVASINGEPIRLSAVQALMDSRSSSLGIPHRPSLEAMKSRYGGALGTLIVHTLVRQDLERRGMAVTDAALEHAVDQVREDFGPGGLEQFLTASSLREADWKALMRDHLAMEVFRKRVLLPAIQVSMAEARAYYEAHKGDFVLPGYLDVCFAAAPEKEALAAYCQSFTARFRERPEADAEADFAVLSGAAASDSGALAQCLEVQPDEVPPAWRKEAASLKPGTCGQPRQQDGEWRAIALAGRQKGHALELTEAYPLIEAILLEEKKSAAFGEWLEANLGRSEILVAPELKESLLTPGLPGFVTEEPEEGDELDRPESQQGREDDAAATADEAAAAVQEDVPDGRDGAHRGARHRGAARPAPRSAGR
ncbi:MAG: peptidyl-prolyl cis-trans isomerase [Desulfovibrio sp.]|uniref:peptidylprolyl isomerase n=1 Tax=Desulfovibrio sp. TaxID=885 RepID=UPI001A750209|nr:peptidylprolyl isomerase [Desulfovibrio sp.]MBD5417637.1 peptidyl-prolyl cis-trans isomerase [Desulfovibrio sp.]